MATTLPVKIEFSLPEGWQPAPPDEVGAPGVAFIALHPESRDGFTANITIAGKLYEETDLVSMADASVQRLGEAATVRVAERKEVGNPEAPALAQTLRISTSLHGRLLELVQSQVYLLMQDVHDPTRRAVIELVLTAKPTQLDLVVEDFKDFVRSLRPADPSAG
ncbi:hypothetical protein [Streptomyces yunnanensis]|uniref:DUF1795 domain-containing protein n=1 Tax=Streptomyces yunnanensis TaxID=156453 RepID=A0A9X8MIF5_9ACTN|nr:hypothetical protein [Streptomyces yunnanensis]SHK73298.1 hypothetical protein SAMN05216268_101137 [Streptomyces yunnanensis]